MKTGQLKQRKRQAKGPCFFLSSMHRYQFLCGVFMLSFAIGAFILLQSVHLFRVCTCTYVYIRARPVRATVRRAPDGRRELTNLQRPQGLGIHLIRQNRKHDLRAHTFATWSIFLELRFFSFNMKLGELRFHFCKKGEVFNDFFLDFYSNNYCSLLEMGVQAWLTEEKGRLRCKFGRHVPINEGQAKPFEDFFHHCSAGGFHAYDFDQDSTLNDMVRPM